MFLSGARGFCVLLAGVRGRVIVLLAAAVGVGVFWSAVLTGSARAELPAECLIRAGTIQVRCFYYIHGTYTFMVPRNVRSLEVTAVGARGGLGYGLSGDRQRVEGGLGASVRDAAVPVSAGEALRVVVGGAGGDGKRYVGGDGGSPGGGGAGGDAPATNEEFAGGGGGGYSGLEYNDDGYPLVIAAGGGGGGGFPPSSRSANGGYGDIGTGGGGGDGCFASSCGRGGGGASGDMGGSGGAGESDGAFGGNGGPGVRLAGGRGGDATGYYTSSGGGGGGGYAGGGGGGGGNSAGGGGGGSSHGVGAGLSDEVHATGSAEVTIIYTVPGLKLADELLSHTDAYAPDTPLANKARAIRAYVYDEQAAAACGEIPSYLVLVNDLTTLTPEQADLLAGEAIQLASDLGCTSL